jgi:hypothetical protein
LHLLEKMEKYHYHRIFELDRELRAAGADEDSISLIMAGGEAFSGSSKKEAIGIWLAGAMDRMDALLPGDMTKKARMRNACSLSGSRLAVMKEIAKMKLSLPEAVGRVNASAAIGFNGNAKGYEVRLDGDKIHVNFGFGRCWCHCSYSGRKVSVTYCYCCLGHVLRLLEAALGRKPLTGEVIGSTCSGSAPCRFVVNLS